MISYLFRFVAEDGKPTGWYGMAFAKNKMDLFCRIDEHGDPNACEVMAIDSGSVCLFTKSDEADGEVFQSEDFANEENQPELDERTSYLISFGDRWVKPNWT